MTETTPITIDTPHGKLYIAVARAKEDSYHDFERGNVTDLHPLVRIATDPTFEADPNHADHWEIRRRNYAAHQTLYWHDLSHTSYATGTNLDFWHSERNPYNGGFRNDRRGQVEFRTKTYDMMRQTVADALDEFDKTHPGWKELSVYLLLHAKLTRELDEAYTLRKEADEHEDKAKVLTAQAQPMFDALPDTLRALIRD